MHWSRWEQVVVEEEEEVGDEDAVWWERGFYCDAVNHGRKDKFWNWIMLEKTLDGKRIFIRNGANEFLMAKTA